MGVKKEKRRAARIEGLEGYLDHRRPKSDGALLSFPKSGRTWLGYMYAYYAAYALLGDDADRFIDHEMTPGAHAYRPHEYPDLLQLVERSEGRVPVISFAHGFPAEPYYRFQLDLRSLKVPAAVLLARDPRDVAVSYFHHTMHRPKMREHGRGPSPDVDLSEFLRSECFGIRAVVTYMNLVAERGPEQFERFAILHYEDFVSDPAQMLARFLTFFGVSDPDQEAIERCVRRTSFGALQQLELSRRARKLRSDAQPDSLRFRRGVPGSHRDELEPDDIAYLDRVVEGHLAPAFARYRRSAALPAR